jgi:alpha-1,3-glucosyltransferase
MREVSDTPTLAKASLCLTLLLLAPTAAFLMRRGHRSARQLVTCLVTSALAFFLASFQVHEKSLLLAMVPAALLIDKRDIPFGVWFQALGLFTMLPLLVKDRLALPAAACTVVYLIVASLLYADVRPRKDRDEPTLVRIVQVVRTGFYRVSYVAMALILCTWALVPPPPHLPDLYPVVVALFGVVNICFAYLYFLFDLYVKNAHVRSPDSPWTGPVFASAKAADPQDTHPLKSE